MTSSTMERQGSQIAVSENLKNGLLGGAAAAVVGLIVLFIGNALVGPIEVAQQPGAPMAPLPLFMVVVATMVPAVVGALLLSALQRFTGKGARIFQIVAVVVTLFSLFPALTQAGTAAASVVLVLLHLMAAGTIVWALTLRPA